jgi:hypothetical protein
MATVHRTLDGAWAACNDEACPLMFHFPDMTLEEAQQLPIHVLYPLLDVIDPPTFVGLYYKAWSNPDRQVHRDYDLPAVVWNDGKMEWWQHDSNFRDNDKPHTVWPTKLPGTGDSR